jgi:hypothetical protein
LWICIRSTESVRSSSIERVIWAMPSLRPRVHTFVATKARGSPRRASKAPAVASARPYIGELSTTVPPAVNSASRTPGNSD